MKIFFSFFIISSVLAITFGAPTEIHKNRRLIPTLTDFWKLSGLSSLSELFGSPSSGDSSKLPNLENLPTLPDKLKLAGLPGLGDLSKLPNLSNFESGAKIDEEKLRSIIPHIGFIKKLPGISYLPGYPETPLPTILVKPFMWYYKLIKAYVGLLEKLVGVKDPVVVDEEKDREPVEPDGQQKYDESDEDSLRDEAARKKRTQRRTGK